MREGLAGALFSKRPAVQARVEGEGFSLSLVLRNLERNVLERITGKAQIFDENGREVGQIALPEILALPNWDEKLRLEPPFPLPQGEYRVVLTLETSRGRGRVTAGTWVVP